MHQKRQLDPAEGIAMLLVVAAMALFFGLFALAAVINS